jgi:hypothetical protein
MEAQERGPFFAAWSEPPEMDAGAPCPALLCDEHELFCGYYVGPKAAEQRSVAVLKFEGVLLHRFGYPNDEALAGHPLWRLGLGFYHFYTVENSPWRAEIESQNSVHRHHHPGIYEKFRHWLITFHDSTLEVLAQRARIIGRTNLSPDKAVVELRTQQRC